MPESPRNPHASPQPLLLPLNPLPRLRQTSMGKRGFASAVIGFLLTVRDGHPTTPIVVTSPIFGTWRETLGPSKAIFAPDEGQTVENQVAGLTSTCVAIHL